MFLAEMDLVAYQKTSNNLSDPQDSSLPVEMTPLHTDDPAAPAKRGQDFPGAVHSCGHPLQMEEVTWTPKTGPG